MNEATARSNLSLMVAAGDDPVLSSADLDALMALARRTDVDGQEPYMVWRPSIAYGVGEFVVPTSANGHYYEVTTAGTAGTTQPTWPTASAATVTQDGVTYKEAGVYDWTPTHDLNAAAAEGWRWKAGRVASDSSSSSLAGDRDPDTWKYLNCIRMAEHYAKRSGPRSIAITAY